MSAEQGGVDYFLIEMYKKSIWANNLSFEYVQEGWNGNSI
jgi:hypothetical protein